MFHDQANAAQRNITQTLSCRLHRIQREQKIHCIMSITDYDSKNGKYMRFSDEVNLSIKTKPPYWRYSVAKSQLMEICRNSLATQTVYFDGAYNSTHSSSRKSSGHYTATTCYTSNSPAVITLYRMAPPTPHVKSTALYGDRKIEIKPK